MTTHNLPRQSTPFIGRVGEVADIAQLLADPGCQLLTLVGAGGSGKTRLAIQVAAQNLDTFPNGVYFVPLSPLSSPEHIVPTIANAMSLFIDAGEDPKQQLLNTLRPKRALLVMDNFEHLLEGATLVAEILEAAPDLKMLATSREALNLQEEWVRHVTGMRFPNRQQDEHIEEYSAVQLFLARANQIRGDFVLANERSSVIHICQLVEGMPLGIELAAAWLKTLTCAQVASEIQQGIDFLSTPLRNAPERHRSMRAVFDHSWKLLTHDEQAVFRRLAVFRGGFEREAAERVANASLRTLSALVDKSLVNVNIAGRYDIHELLRQYGEEQLEAAGERDSTQQAHGQYYAAFMQQREADLKGRNQLTALNQIEADFENLRVAWTWAVNQENYDAINASLESLHLFCEMRTRLLEGYELLGQAREQFAGTTEKVPGYVWIRIVTRWIQIGRLYRGTPARCQEMKAPVKDCLTAARADDDRPEIAYCLWTLGTLAHNAFDMAGAITPLQESLALFAELNDSFNMARAADYLGAAYMDSDRLKSVQFSQQSLDLRRQIGDKCGITQALTNLVSMAEVEGRYAEAEHYLWEIDAILREMGGVAWVSRCTANLAFIAFCQGDILRTRTLAQAVLESAPDSTLSGKWSALIVLSLIACIDEDYVRAKQLGEQFLLADMSRVVSGNFKIAEAALAMVACGLSDYATAKHYLQITMKFALDLQSIPDMAWSLPVAATILVHEGLDEQAVEILALIDHHPGSANGWMQQWPLLTRLRAELQAELHTDLFAAAWERGKSSDLAAVVTAFFNRIQAESGDAGQGEPSILSRTSTSTWTVLDPLSERELEVLRGVADGLSNDEIASQLVIGLSTVKTHINHLYNKLGVKSRTQAIARAKSLNLI